MVKEYHVPELSANPLGWPADINKNLWDSALLLWLGNVVDGSTPSNPTSVQIGIWNQFLFVRFNCISNTLRAKLTQPGAPVWEEEAVEVFLQPPDTSNTYYEIDLNPLNTLTQLRIYNNGEPGTKRVYKGDSSWHCSGLKTRVWIEGLMNRPGQCKSWVAELAIPFPDLTTHRPVFPAGWRANFFRVDAGGNPLSYQAWQPTGQIDFHRMEYFAQLKLPPR